ncbi:hypothetical protein FGRMN_10889 [Fusarium graminum]|nr:hypothetical protein FGRMN_10889 [Fusarium graminum]
MCNTVLAPSDKNDSFVGLGEDSGCAFEFDSHSWSDSNMVIDIDSLCLSWAGQLEAFGSPNSLFTDRTKSNSEITAGTRLQIPPELPDSGTFHDTANPRRAALSSPDGSSTSSTETDKSFHLDRLSPFPGRPEHQHSFKVFGKIMQPPAAMLMGGIKKWRHLQQYLVNLAWHNDAVMSALLGLDKVLEWDSISDSMASSREFQDHIHNTFNATVCMIQQDITLPRSGSSSKMDDWLAAIFLLAWIQVLRDRVEHDSESLFPAELAETIITYYHDWNWYSRQLLSWFNSFDSKASHLGGPALLSSKALKVVSQYPIQIISCDYEESKCRSHSLRDDKDFQSLVQSPVSRVSEHGGSGAVLTRSPCDVKDIVLRAILQPAAEWYLKTQAYCRQISALDKHHCKRFTPDTEMKVAHEGKQIDGKLWDLWAQCPSLLSLSTAELSMSVAPDMATRLQEVSSVYLASFWILFVYLHRVCWWHLPHTETVTDALGKTWQHMKNSYGEADDNSLRRTVHPALMWPVFLFGAECKVNEHRNWAIEQLEALGRARPVLRPQNQSQETLPAFRISHGATRNAKRAALLLQALTQKQEEINCRVDDRDLAMDMFGCYFSIV